MSIFRRLFQRLMDHLFGNRDALYIGVEPDPQCVDGRRWRQERYIWNVSKQS